MRSVIAVLAIGAFSLSAADQPAAKEVYYLTGARRLVPRFDKGYLIYYERPCGLEVFGPSGQLVFKREFTGPGGTTCGITSAAVRSDGSFALTIAYPSGGGYSGGIQFADATGKPTHFADTQKWRPSHLVFDKKDNLWVIGWQVSASREPEEYFLVRRFAKDGREDGRFVPRSQWPTRGEPVSFGLGYWTLAAADDRIGAVIYHSFADRTEEWVEWDLNGNQLSRTPTGGDNGRGRAYLANGHLIAQDVGPNTGARQLFYLDRQTKTWLPYMDASDLGCGMLSGAEGNQIVCRTRGTDQSLLRWIDLPELPPLR